MQVGLVALAELRSPDARLRDATLADDRFDAISTLVERGDEFETWSRLCFPALLSPPAAS